jgi:hypothetical protein
LAQIIVIPFSEAAESTRTRLCCEDTLGRPETHGFRLVFLLRWTFPVAGALLVIDTRGEKVGSRLS